MTVITIILVLLAIAAFLALVVGMFVAMEKFNKHCEGKFQHRFFTKTSFIFFVVSFVMLWGGWSLYQYDAHLKPPGDVLDGEILIGIAVAALAFATWRNIARTDLLYGIGGSLMQVPIFLFVAYLGLYAFMIMVALALPFAIFANTAPVRVVYRYWPYREW